MDIDSLPKGTRLILPAKLVVAALETSKGPLGAASRSPRFMNPLRALGWRPVVLEVVELLGPETAIAISHLDGSPIEVPDMPQA